MKLPTKCLRLLYLLILFKFPFSVVGQNTSGLPIDTTDINILIDLALQNDPLVKQTDFAIEKLELQKKYVNNSWLNLISVNGNLNELSIRQIVGSSDGENNIFFPRYNFGLGFRVGQITGIRQEKTLLTKDIEITQINRVQRENEIRNNVKQQYYNYLIFRERYSVKRSFQELATVSFNNIEKRFSEGDVLLEQYYQAREEYFNFKVELLNAEQQFLKSKADLELLVGQPLEKVGIGLSTN